MTPFTTKPAIALFLAVAIAGLAGCPTKQQLAEMPGLSDSTPTGPEGRKCYERCSQLEASCKHMCPKVEGICHEDCEIDTKLCLKDCPQIHRQK